MILFLLGCVISATMCGALVALNVVTYPLEGFCLVLEEHTRFSFTVIRWAFDIFYVVSCVAVSLILGLAFAVREGTVIAMVCYSPIMGLMLRKMRRVLQRKGITEPDITGSGVESEAQRKEMEKIHVEGIEERAEAETQEAAEKTLK